jgi:endoglucanase
VEVKLSARTRARPGLWAAAAVASCLGIVSAFIPLGNSALASTAPRTTSTTTSTTTSSSAGGNLLSSNAATFAGGTGGWFGINSTLSWAKYPSTLKTGSLAITAKATSWVQAWSPFPPYAPGTPATPGGKFEGGAAFYETGSPEPVSVGLTFLNSSNKAVETELGQVVTPSTGTWAQLPAAAAIAPASTAWVVLGVVQYGAAVGQKSYMESPVLSALGQGAPAVVGPLHTSGNQVIQANGVPIILRGVVLEGLEASAQSAGVTQNAVLEAKAWGANFVRVPLGEQFWLSTNCDYAPGYQTTVDQVVNWITSQGMVALLDLHTNTVSGCEPGTEHNMADATQSPTFWSQVAGRYGSPSSPEYNPLVAFDLYNEPHDISDAVWLDGGQTTDTFSPYETYQAAGMQQLYDAVRGSGAQSLVFVSGNNWANNPPSVPVNGTNIVYAVHYYTCPTAAPPSCSNPNPYDPSQDLNLWVPDSAFVPIAVTEFGWPSDSDGTYLSNVIAFANAHGWGWSAYAWLQENWGGMDFENWLSDGTAEPQPSGVPVLLALSGSG